MTLGICKDCIRSHGDEALLIAREVHGKARRVFELAEEPPRAGEGAQCMLCAQQCEIGPGQRGYCGLRRASGRKLLHLAGTPKRGLLHWYRDALPTNCVADWVCAGHQKRGYHNLAVFYASCTLNCLFCQNWHFREVSPVRARGLHARELADTANARTFCACFFGGDPASQMPHALAAAKYLSDRGVVVCWETAGTSNPKLLDRAVQLSLETGGCIKFDLKAYDETLHKVLTGSSNRRTLENFTRVAGRIYEGSDHPLLIASTLLVPGYVDAEEVGRIANFIASLNPHIPYSLLGFAPDFFMPDLPLTSHRHADAAARAAREAGLTRVHIGNQHLLSSTY